MNNIIVVQLSNHRADQAFCDYLKTKNIQAWTEQKEMQFLILINDSDNEDFVCAELRDFLNNPSDRKYLDASWNEGSTETSVVTTSGNLSGGNTLNQFISRAGVMTKALVLMSVVITLVTSFGSNIDITKYLMIADPNPAVFSGELTEILSGEIWRLLTPIFLHFMTIHILFNMMWLWDLGGNVEKIQSSQFLLFFVVSIGIMSNLIQFYSTGPAFGGMSGVVYGLLGYTWIRSFKQTSGYTLPKSIVILMLALLVIGYSGLLGAIGNSAHLSGLILGMAYGFAWNQYE